MNPKEMFFDALVNCNNNGYPYKVGVVALVNEHTDIPQNVRQKFPEHLMLNLSSDMTNNVQYDFDTSVLSFDAKFSGIHHRVQIHSNNIVQIIDEFNEMTLHFQQTSNKIQVAEKIELTGVSNNKEYTKTKPTGKLELITNEIH